MQPLIIKHFTTIRKLFFEYGIRCISMDDIAHRLHISKKTMYKEYICKDELVKDLFMNDYHQLKTALNSLGREKMDAITKTMRMYSITQRSITSISALVLYDLEKYYSSLLNELVVMFEELVHQSFIGILSEGKADNYFHSKIKPDSIARLSYFLFESYALSRISESKDGFTLNWNDVLDYHFRSICNPFGLNKWEILKKQNLKSQSDKDDQTKNLVRCRI
jgi:AcrR family transcriptional regulator